MPDRAIYWYGWAVGTITNPCPAQQAGYTTYAASVNTRDITINKAGTSTQRGLAISSVNATGMTKFKTIKNNVLASTDISNLGNNLYCGIYDIVHSSDANIWWNRVSLLSNLTTPLSIVADIVESSVNSTYIVTAVWLE